MEQKELKEDKITVHHQAMHGKESIKGRMSQVKYKIFPRI
jgi:hypothetical protein